MLKNINMNYLHKIFLSHQTVFELHYMNEKISIFISQKCLLINFFSVSAVFNSEILFKKGDRVSSNYGRQVIM